MIWATPLISTYGSGRLCPQSVLRLSGPRETCVEPRTGRTMQMKAAVIYENGDPGVLRYEDVAEPECPDGFVVVDAEAISIEGGDLLARAAGQPPAVPHVVGYLSAGTVSEVGARVEARAVGDRVVALSAAGSHAARRAVPAP